MEAATVAWHPLGWTPLAFSEIEPFPKALLQHKYPNIPNYGDLTKFDEWPLPVGNVDLVVGGTPCQAWSVAGKRLGLDDPRGRVALAYAGFIEKHRPRWIVWENVPGVYSAGKPGGSDFAAFVGTLVKFGYHIAYRTLNAEYFGVPQRRRRCILVGYLGDWRPAAAVLFEPESLRRDIKKGRKKGEGITSGPQGGVGPSDPRGCWWDGGQTSQTLDAVLAKGQTMPDKNRFPAVLQPVCATGETTHCLTSSHRGSEDGTGRGTPIVCATGSTTHALTASSNKGATEDGTGRGTPIVIDRAAFNQGVNAQYEPHIEATETMDTLISKGPHAVGVPFFPTVKCDTGDQSPHVAMPVVPLDGMNLLSLLGKCGEDHSTQNFTPGDPCFTLKKGGSQHGVLTPMAVRRLTPEECEALQGFEKGYSRIPWKGKPADQCPDGPRYKACGNSMAVPVMRWVGERIALVDKLISQTQPEQPKP
jgi:DNA (cytosine-5)-methyltransferase 1